MTLKILQKYAVSILTIIFLITFSFTGCIRVYPEGGEEGSQEVREEEYAESEISEGHPDQNLMQRAYRFAQSTVQESYPNADIISSYSPDKVVEEAPGVFQVEVEGNSGSIWYCVCQYIEAGDSFEVIELVQAGRGEADTGEEYAAQEDQDEDPQGESQDSTPQEQAPPEEEPQDSQPEEQAPEEETPQQEPLTEREIMEKAFYAAQADIKKNFTGVEFYVNDYNETYIDKIEDNLYQCAVSFTANEIGADSDNSYGYICLVRYDSNKDKMYVSTKRERFELNHRYYWQAQNYVENTEKTNGNCDEIIFKYSKPEGETPEKILIAIPNFESFDTCTAMIEFECQKGGNVNNRIIKVSLRYDITTDSFTDFRYVDQQ
jgi:hypothetical protein